MNKNISIALGIIVIIVAITWTVLTINKSADNKMMNDQDSNPAMETQATDNAMMTDQQNDDNESMIKDQNKNEVMMDDGNKQEAMMEKPGAYKNFSQTTLSSEQAAGNKVVLFFYASWCPFCKTADAAFQAKASEIPSGVTVLKTDYDSEKALKTKYGVTTQHTFVQIDNNGNQVAKWVSGDIAELKANLK